MQDNRQRKLLISSKLPSNPGIFFFPLSSSFLYPSSFCSPCPLAPPPRLFPTYLRLPPPATVLFWDAVMYLFTALLLPVCHHSILAVFPSISSSSSSPPAITQKPVFQLAFLSPTKHLLSLSGPPFGEGGRPPS